MMIRPNTRAWLLFSARAALKRAFVTHYGKGHALPLATVDKPEDPILHQSFRIFVTWRDGEELVGCIGSLVPTMSLDEAVPHYSVLAAMKDPRTPTPHPAQWDDLHCSISVLTEPTPLDAIGLDAITRAVVPHRDGVAIQSGHKRALLLPSVWDNLPDPQVFMSVLAHKAGIDPQREGPTVTAEIFGSEKFAERPGA